MRFGESMLLLFETPDVYYEYQAFFYAEIKTL